MTALDPFQHSSKMPTRHTHAQTLFTNEWQSPVTNQSVTVHTTTCNVDSSFRS